MLIFPSQPLTTLTPRTDLHDITDSVRKGQSWHAYQEYKKHQEQLEKLSIELDAAKQRIAELDGNRTATGSGECLNECLLAGAVAYVLMASRMTYLMRISAQQTEGCRKFQATDAFLAEARAQGVEMMREHPSIKLCSLTHIFDELAAQLRKGRAAYDV